MKEIQNTLEITTQIVWISMLKENLLYYSITEQKNRNQISSKTFAGAKLMTLRDWSKKDIKIYQGWQRLLIIYPAGVLDALVSPLFLMAESLSYSRGWNYKISRQLISLETSIALCKSPGFCIFNSWLDHFRTLIHSHILRPPSTPPTPILKDRDLC